MIGGAVKSAKSSQYSAIATVISSVSSGLGVPVALIASMKSGTT